MLDWLDRYELYLFEWRCLYISGDVWRLIA